MKNIQNYYNEFISQINARHPQITFSPKKFSLIDGDEREKAERIVLNNCICKKKEFVKYFPFLEKVNLREELTDGEYDWCINVLKNTMNPYLFKEYYFNKLNTFLKENNLGSGYEVLANVGLSNERISEILQKFYI